VDLKLSIFGTERTHEARDLVLANRIARVSYLKEEESRMFAQGIAT
jgi:hypothetical protein